MERTAAQIRGVTLAELLVALAIVGLLAALAAPGFARLRSAAVVGGAADHLLASLHAARSAAALRGIPTLLCLTADGSTCLAKARHAARGWLIAESRDGEPQRILQRFDLPARISIRGTRPAVIFWPVARAATTATFEICPTDAIAPGRAVIVSQTGRPRIDRTRVDCAP